MQNPSPYAKTEKPLPSLPVATVKFQSPLRRSLIDCTEKPLRRRSMTPPDGSDPVEEDWPAIEPTKSDSKRSRHGGPAQIKPSLGESLYEGMRSLNLRDNDVQDAQNTDTNSRSNESSATEKKVTSDMPIRSMNMERDDVTPGELLSDGRNRPISSSQLPKPRDSMLKSLSRHHDSPIAIRHTKASTLRLQQATGKSTWDPNEKDKSANNHFPTIRERAEASIESKVKQDFRGGPIRSTSRGRYGVTGRGSPYTVPSRAPSSRKRRSRDESSGFRRPFHASMNSRDSKNSRDGGDSRTPNSPSRPPRKSSLPLPAHLVRVSTKPEHEQHEVAELPAVYSMSTTNHEPGVIASVTQPGEISNIRRRKVGSAHGNELVSSTQSNLLNIREALSTQRAENTMSFVGSDEETASTSIRGYDSHGGYKIRRIGNDKSKMGPTLRITDSASRVLLGQDEESNVLNARSPVTLRHKGSAPNVGSPRMVKDDGRRSSAMFADISTPVFARRTLSLRNSSSHTYPEGPRLVSDETGSADTVVAQPALANDDVESTANITASTDDDWITPMRTPRPSTSTQDTPKSEHGDWPGKEFAEFRLCADATPTTSRDHAQSVGHASKPDCRRPTVSRSSSRPPTIVLREAPSKETAPFLFQDLKQEQVKQEKLADDLAIAAGSSSETSLATHTTYSAYAGSSSSLATGARLLPPRSSSRKPKPPPIFVSPPSISFVPNPAPKAYAVPSEGLKKPRNVKTFSQSLSPNVDSSKGRNISAVLSHTPSASGKKVVSSLRGLFHKKSFEEKKAAAAARSNVKEEIEPVPASPALPYDENGHRRTSFRRKPVPAFDRSAGNENRGRKFSNPLHLKSTAAIPAGMRSLKHKNAFVSPTTPWTANLRTPPYPPSSYPNAAAPSSKSTSPSLLPHGHPSPSLYSPRSPGTPGTPSSSQQLSTATALTHALLDLARTEHTPTKKSHLIELSKCMVEVVNSARDAEKAMEKARMEASRAEVSYLRCLKEVSAIEGLVRGIGIVKSADLEIDTDGRGVNGV